MKDPAMITALFPGTFDPIHNGHLLVAQAALEQGIDQVVFLPVGKPWKKAPVASWRARFRMIDLALDNAALSVASHEAERQGYVEKLPYTALGASAVIIGADAVRNIQDLAWLKGEGIRLLIAPRVGVPMVYEEAGGHIKVRHIYKAPYSLDDPLAPDTEFLGGREYPWAFSSSAIRQRVARGLSLRYWVPPAVEDYIKKHGLYKAKGVIK